LNPTDFDAWWSLGVYYAQRAWFMLDSGNGPYIRDHQVKIARIQRRALHCLLQAARLWQAKAFQSEFAPLRVPLHPEAHPPLGSNTQLALWVHLVLLCDTIITSPMHGFMLRNRHSANAADVWKQRFEQVLNKETPVEKHKANEAQLVKVICNFGYTACKNAMKLAPQEWIYSHMAGRFATKLDRPVDEIVNLLTASVELEAKTDRKRQKDLPHFLDPHVKLLSYLVKSLNSGKLSEEQVLEIVEKVPFFKQKAHVVKTEDGKRLHAKQHAGANDLLFAELSHLRKTDYHQWYSKPIVLVRRLG